MSLADAIANGKSVVTAECRPPRGADAARLKACAAALGGMVNAICAPESEDGARLSSLAACGHLAAAGAEPVLHLLTRDANRIGLQAQVLGAASMGIKNLLCLTGRHQALTSSDMAKGVFDLDPVQLLHVADRIRKEGVLADGQAIDTPVQFTLGTDTNPFADPVELQVIALEKAVNAGADFVMTQPVFNFDRFNVWMTYVRERGIHTKTCLIASVLPVTTSQEAVKMAEKYKLLDIPEDVIERLNVAQDNVEAGVHLATETIASLSKIEGIRGVHLMTGADFELARTVIEASGLARS